MAWRPGSQLCWRRRDPWQQRPPIYQAPTLSWASIDGWARYLPVGGAEHYYIKILEVQMCNQARTKVWTKATKSRLLDCHGRGFYLFRPLKPLGFHARWFHLLRSLRPLSYHSGDMYIRTALPPLRLEESEVTINSIQAPSQIGCLVQLVPTCSTREVSLMRSDTNS